MNNGREILNFDSVINCKQKVEIAQSTMDSLSSVLNGFSPNIFTISGYISSAKKSIASICDDGADLSYSIGKTINNFLEENPVEFDFENENYLYFLVNYGEVKDWEEFIEYLEQYKLMKQKEYDEVEIDGELLEAYNSFYNTNEQSFQISYDKLENFLEELKLQSSNGYDSSKFQCPGGEVIEVLEDGSLKMQRPTVDDDGNIIYVDMTEDEKAIIEDWIPDAQAYYKEKEGVEKLINLVGNKLVPKSELEEKISSLGVLINTIKNEAKKIPYEKEMNSEEFQKYYNQNNNKPINTAFDVFKSCPPRLRDKINFLNDEEKMYLKYKVENEGNRAGWKYLDDIEDELNKREGIEAANKIIMEISSLASNPSYTLVAKGGLSGVANFTSGFSNLLAPDGNLSANDYMQLRLNQYFSLGVLDDESLQSSYENGLISEEEYKMSLAVPAVRDAYALKRTVSKYAYGISETVGNQAIPILLNSVAPGVGTAARTASTYGNYLEGNYQEGFTGTKAVFNSALKTLVEVAPDMFGLGLNTLAPSGLKSIIGNGRFFVSTVGEVLEENVQNYGQKFVDYMTDKEVDMTPNNLFKEFIDTSIMTFGSAGILGSFGSGFSKPTSNIDSTTSVTLSGTSTEILLNGLKSDAKNSLQNGEISYGEYSKTLNQLDNFSNLYNTNMLMNNGKGSGQMIENLMKNNLKVSELNHLLNNYSEILKGRLPQPKNSNDNIEIVDIESIQDSEINEADNQTTILGALQSAVNISKATTEALKTVSESVNQQNVTTSSTLDWYLDSTFKGVNQHDLSNMIVKGLNNLKNEKVRKNALIIVNKLIKQAHSIDPNISSKDVYRLLEHSDGINKGICDYASRINVIAAKARVDNKFRAEIEKNLSFELFDESGKIDPYGLIELLGKMYVHFNVTNTSSSDSVIKNSKYNSRGIKQSAGGGYEFSKFLESLNVDYSVVDWMNNVGKFCDLNKLIEIIKKGCDDQELMILDVTAVNKEVNYYKYETTDLIQKMDIGGNGHSTFVIGTTDDSVILASWGSIVYIPYSELSDDNRIRLHTYKFTEKGEN